MAWLTFIAELIVIALLLIVLAALLAMPTYAAEVEAMATLQHDSNLVDGWPRNSHEEAQHDFLGGGVTITAGARRAWEIDIAHGIKSVDRGRRETGTHFAVRFYPGRRN